MDHIMTYEEYLRDVVRPLLEANRDEQGVNVSIEV